MGDAGFLWESSMSATFDLGMVGLGVMGRNLLLNLADHGFHLLGRDTDPAKVKSLVDEAKSDRVDATTDLAVFVSKLKLPRAIILLVPAGKIVDAALKELTPLLSPGDLVIDAGNSQFKDTDRRGLELAAKGLNFFGMGVSGGESGARHGPSMMPGGPKDAYERVRPMFEAIAAKVNGEPCVTYVGAGSAGHFVKMVHNGIEYGVMQILAEVYDLLHRGLGLTNPELAQLFADWHQGELNSYLMEITAKIFRQIDPVSGNHLVDMILDVARSKGTGKWTSQEAMDLQAPLTVIDSAVTGRDLSSHDAERLAASKLYPPTAMPFNGDRSALIEQVKHACHLGIIVSYAQGFAMLRKASQTYQYGLNLAEIAKIWRGGCIIRSTLLETIRAAFTQQPDLPNLLLDGNIATTINAQQADLRASVKAAIDLGVPMPALASALSWFDGYRSSRLPTNLTQAQRDFFGAHTYERIDQKGTFHTKWEE
jgi:6-phosphogluconate dehydrogenase